MGGGYHTLNRTPKGLDTARKREPMAKRAADRSRLKREREQKKADKKQRKAERKSERRRHNPIR